MNIKNIAGVAVLVLTVAFAIQLVQHNNAEARSPIQVSQTQSQSSSTRSLGIEYAMLRIEDDGESVTWLIGGNDRVRTESVKETYRRLGGRGRGSFSDLLNQIGTMGWSLVQKDGSTWIFSRRAL